VHGGFAEYLLAWESHATPIPESLTPGEAAPLFCAGGTVFSALSKVKLDRSTHLGIWGAGGLGQYGIQLGKFAGARVTAIDLSPSRLELARSLRADTAMGAEEATEWFGKAENRVNVALVCASSAEAYRSAFQALQKNGVLLIVGIPSAPLAWTAGDLIRSGVRIIPSRVASRRELSDLVKLAQDGVVRSEIVSFPLKKINDAIQALSAGEIRGRAVIHPDP
jgi:propanol-preferring alcohol dehydrogenase